jgi:hypothetical protein
MCGCGKASNAGTASSFSGNARMHGSQSGMNAIGVTFEYIGETSLTAVGGVTQRRYHFPAAQARAHVDQRDFASLLQIPLLRHIR